MHIIDETSNENSGASPFLKSIRNLRDVAYGEVSKKLIPRRKASRTVAMASSSDTGPKTFPRGEAPKPTELSLRPVVPSSRSSTLAVGGDAIDSLNSGKTAGAGMQRRTERVKRWSGVVEVPS